MLLFLLADINASLIAESNYESGYFEVINENVTVYDNRNGSLIPVGKLEKGEVYPRVSDYGNWHRIQFGDYYGYVSKEHTIPANGASLKNENKNQYSTTWREIKANQDVVVYDNTSGALVPFGTIIEGTQVTAATSYGNWWRVVISDRVGYVRKSEVTAGFTKEDQYFEVIAEETIVYEKTTDGPLKPIGTLDKGEVYPRVSDHGNWHRIQFGDYYGYVRKTETKYPVDINIKNENNGQYSTTGPVIVANHDVEIYDNTSGNLVRFATLDKGTSINIATNFGNWWRVVISDRVGYLRKNEVTIQFSDEIEYFEIINDDGVVYDEPNGNKIGILVEGQTFPRISGYGNWHQIQFGDYDGYVSKKDTAPVVIADIENENNGRYSTTWKDITALQDVVVYDNTSGNLIPFAIISEGTRVTAATSYGNWWRVVISDRVGYVRKSEVTEGFSEENRYFQTRAENVSVYDEPNGKVIGTLYEGETFPRVSDYGDWHQIQFGDGYGYVEKKDTIVSEGTKINNENNNRYSTTWRKVTANQDIVVYDNTSGNLVPFINVKEGTEFTAATSYGNWWRVVISDRVGYVRKNEVTADFSKDDKYFKVVNEDTIIYDNRDEGPLKPIGKLVNGEVYPRVSDFGNWHRIQFGDYYGYVSKADTKYVEDVDIVNENNNRYKTDGQGIKAIVNATIYDNSSGELTPFATVYEGTTATIASDYGNWWRVVISDRVGYVRKSEVEVLATEIVRYINYDLTLEQMVDIQMGLSTPPQTDKYRGENGWVYKDDLRVSGNRAQIISGEITGNNVYLRTSPDTTKTPYTQVGRGTKFEYVESVNGQNVSGSTTWYEIIYDNQTLYVHSSLGSVQANYYAGPGTNHHLYGSISSTTHNFPIVRQQGDWYELDYKPGWRNAPRSDVLQYLDPGRQDVFQHLVLSESTGISASELNKVLNGRGVLSGKGQAFIQAGTTHGINEVYLVSHALLESGNGASDLAKGVEVGLNASGNPVLVTTDNRNTLRDIRTVYNMYGIGAYDGCALRCGAIEAYNSEWFTVDSAIIGGAEFVSKYYFARGQNTLYKMRWNPDAPGSYQYATDVGWAAKQINRIKQLYDELDNVIKVFEIPVYK